MLNRTGYSSVLVQLTMRYRVFDIYNQTTAITFWISILSVHFEIRYTELCACKRRIDANPLSESELEYRQWTNFSEMLIEIVKFSLTKMRLNVSSSKWRPFSLCLNMFKFRWYDFYALHGKSLSENMLIVHIPAWRSTGLRRPRFKIRK